MASAGCDLSKLLDLLDLSDYYPEKLTRQDLYQITKDSVSKDADLPNCPVVWRFIHRITRFNYQARNFKATNAGIKELSKTGFRELRRKKKEDEKANIHSLDVLVAVFLCCDPIARQDLVMHLWGCKLAVPFVLQPLKDKKTSVYIWALRSLVSQFQSKEGVSHELTLVKWPMQCIGFIRLGRNERLSKSFLINCLIGGPEKAHPIFFHRDSEGSKPNRSDVVNGTIELGWFLPNGASNDRFDGCRLFANLRGDSRCLCDQRDILSAMANITIVMSSTEELLQSEDIIRSILDKNTCVIILISDQQPNENQISTFLEKNFPEEPDTRLDAVLLGSKRMSETLDELHFYINKMKHDRGVVISDFSKKLPANKIDVDECRSIYLKGIDMTNTIIEAINKVPESERKNRILPFQGENWKEWAQADRDYHRFDQMEPHEKKIYQSRENINALKKKYRKCQYAFLSQNGLSEPMSLFLEAMSLERESKQIFLRYLKLELDEMSRKELQPFYKKYQGLVYKTIAANQDERDFINKSISELDDEKSNLQFGLEHITRELGQIYEACECDHNEVHHININKERSIQHTDLLNYASVILQEGYPLEILDGEASSVPVLWIKGIIKCLNDTILKNSRLHAISVLGIQSSGKSTFLNTIFGLQFAVSAGRCTRGAYMQLVKIHPQLASDICADYIVAIDTEGLKAVEISSDQSIKRDNELSTFVIGLADTTVINLMGENSTYLQENLPIAVHAFLRMNLVGLNPRCTIVHQNVDKRNKDKLLQQGYILLNILNKLTIKACEMEKIPHRLFQDIIDFSIENHTDYIPALLEGEQPMAPISTGYSSESNSVRNKLIEFITINSSINTSTLLRFGQHLGDLWDAIKTDRFVYEFRTTIETEAKLLLETYYSEVMHDLLEEIHCLVSKFTPQMNTKNQEKIIANLSKELKKSHENNKIKLKQFINTEDKTSAHCFQKWKDGYFERLHSKFTKYEKSAIKQVKQAFTIDYNKKQVPRLKGTYSKFFDIYAKHMKTFSTSPEKCFDDAWDKWSKERQLESSHYNIPEDTTDELQQIYVAHKHLINKELVSNSCLTSFIQTEDSKYINNTGHCLSESETRKSLKMISGIKHTIDEELQSGISKVKLSTLPYASHYPGRLLLRVKKKLNHVLAEDTERTIQHQFEIELMVSVGGTIIKELTQMISDGEQLTCNDFKRIKDKLKLLNCKHSCLIEHLNQVIYMSFYSAILEDFHLKQSETVIGILRKSSFGPKIKTKQALLGDLMYYLVDNQNDHILTTYIRSPKSALREHLRNMFSHLYTTEGSIQMHFSETANEVFQQIQTKLKSCKAQNSTIIVKDLLQEISIESVAFTSQLLLDYIPDEMLNEGIHLPLFIETFIGMKDPFVKEINDMIRGYVLFKKEDTIRVCADEVYKRLCGCSELCPFCKEMCKYSENHSGNHETFMHKPIGSTGIRWDTSDILAVETCPFHIYKKNTFKFDGNVIPFNEYKRVYPNWNIKAAESKELVWNYIFGNNTDMTDSLKLPEDVLKIWKQVAMKDVLHALKDCFD